MTNLNHLLFYIKQQGVQLKTSIQSYLFDFDLNTIHMDERIHLSEVLNVQISLNRRVKGYMDVYHDVTVKGMDGIKFEIEPTDDLKWIKTRWYQLAAKLDELQVFILEEVNKYLPITNIVLPDAKDPEFRLDDEGHLILTYIETKEYCDNHFRKQIAFDANIEIVSPFITNTK